METDGALPYSQMSAICSYLDPAKSSLCLPKPFLRIRFIIILSSTPGLQVAPSLRSHHQNPVRTSPASHMSHMPCPSHSSLFDHPHNTWRGVLIIKFYVM